VKLEATEQNDLETALSRLPEAEEFVERLLRRMEASFPLRPPARVLDVGAAQGVAVTAFKRRGFDVVGVEPWRPAIEVSRELARRTGVDTTILPGVAEELPFEDESFDFAHAYSVLEHVDDPDAVLRECHRVLKPGGGLFFSTTSAISPIQGEIARFPLFPWYPPRLQRAIMTWARDQRPWLVGNTTRPAYHWFRHREVRRSLAAAGFGVVVDRWELRRHEGEGLRSAVVGLCARRRAARLVGDIAVPGMEYLALKPGGRPG
jgi:2-polyprenyl-3-methyl-5-hydroxy-6-metoxy-1,4-benzoquinol methylase